MLHIGGIPFPLVGDELPGDEPSISPSDFKILLMNADVIIDQTDFSDGKLNYLSVFERWRALAGITGIDFIPRVVDRKKVYSLDNTVNNVGISGKGDHRRHQNRIIIYAYRMLPFASPNVHRPPVHNIDYQYRMPSRPDLLLRDLIAVQYPLYNPAYKIRFLNSNFQYGQGPGNRAGPNNCSTTVPANEVPFPYNSGDITTSPLDPSFSGLEAPPPAEGGGIYGIGGASPGDGASGSGKSKTTSIITAVVCVAAVLGAAFAFAFYKWSRRAKEDRFIELEEEMNNEIPLN